MADFKPVDIVPEAVTAAEIESRFGSSGDHHTLPASKWSWKDDANEYYLNIDAMGAEKPADVGFLLDKDGKVLYIKALVAERTAIHLPEDANLADIKAHMDAGLIHIHVGKGTAEA